MFVPFFYLDDIFAKQSLNLMVFEQEKHNVDKVMVNEKYHTYLKIFHYQSKHVYHKDDDKYLTFFLLKYFHRMLIVYKNKMMNYQEINMDQEIMLIQVNVDMMLDQDNQENMIDV
jgi:hypothetical protein